MSELTEHGDVAAGHDSDGEVDGDDDIDEDETSRPVHQWWSLDTGQSNFLWTHQIIHWIENEHDGYREVGFQWTRDSSSRWS